MAERGVIFKDDFVTTPGKSWFDMSFDYLFSMNFGELVPSTCMEVMADDIIHAKSDSFVRLAPLVAPTFGKCNMFNYHFYVRNKDIWTDWKSFITNADNRLSWQQALSQGFTPPEMPYIDIFQTLTLLSSHAHQLDPSIVDFSQHLINWDPNRLNIGPAKETYYRLRAFDNVWALVVTEHSGSIYAFVTPSVYLGFPVMSYDDPLLVIPFMQNKYEFEHPIMSTNQGDVDPYIYNPFSNGTLFDYLGVDLTAHYKSQYSKLQTCVTSIKAALNDTTDSFAKLDIDVSFDPSYWGSLRSDRPAYARLIDSMIPFTGNIKDFIESHFVFGIGYSRDDQFSYCNSYGQGRCFSGNPHYSDVVAIDNSDLFHSGTDYCQISALPVRAYHFIYNEYFRDENYIGINLNLDFSRNGNDINHEMTTKIIFDYLTLNIKAYEHDPYTTALPSAQRGSAVHYLPTQSPIYTTNEGGAIPSNTNVAQLAKINSDGNMTGPYFVKGADQTRSTFTSDGSRYALQVDLSAATIENFRFANATQRYLEKCARAGNRYYEYMKAIFGSDIPSEKLDRPIFLGGDKSPIQVSEVLQTSASDLTTDQPLGNMAGRAVSIGNDDYIEYICPDNGFFIELCCVLPRTNYQTGLNPMFTRKTYLDYPIPDYCQLGEEPVLLRDLWFTGSANDEIPFGYQSRYWQWKYNRDRTSGSFKDSLDYWTWTRKFDNAPVQGQKFIEVSPDYRQFAVTSKSTEHVYVHMWHDIQVNRCLPVFGMPSL